jgi:hypothetical protein
MSEFFNTDDISATPPLGPQRRMEEGEEKAPSVKGQPFESYMEEAGKGPGAKGVSPLDLAQSNYPTSSPTMSSVLAQVNSAQSTLGDVHTHLTNKNLKLTNAQKYVLRNKLSDSNGEIRSAAAKAGVDLKPIPHVPANLGPIAKLLSYVTDGQNELASAQANIQSLNDSGKSLSPAKMLFIQVKLNRAQTLLEYSSVLLSKGLDALKTLFNTQM